MKTKPTEVTVEQFLETVSDQRREESHVLIAMMQEISGEKPCMWGPSIIGFGTQHYKYETGTEGDMPRLAFSPRRASITVYLDEGFAEQYAADLKLLGKHKTSKVCLYINKLADVDTAILRKLIARSFAA